MKLIKRAYENSVTRIVTKNGNVHVYGNRLVAKRVRELKNLAFNTLKEDRNLQAFYAIKSGLKKTALEGGNTYEMALHNFKWFPVMDLNERQQFIHQFA